MFIFLVSKILKKPRSIYDKRGANTSDKPVKYRRIYKLDDHLSRNAAKLWSECLYILRGCTTKCLIRLPERSLDEAIKKRAACCNRRSGCTRYLGIFQFYRCFDNG